MKQAQTPVAQASLALIGTLLFAAFLAAAALRPTLLTIASLTRSVGDERKTIATLDKKIQLLGVAQKKLETMKGQLEPANIAIPDNVAMEDFIKEIEVLAKGHELALLEIRQEGFPLSSKAVPTPQPGRIPTVSKIPVRIVVGGAESAIRAFIADLENLDRLVVVTTTNLSGVKIEERKDRPYPLNADISLEIFTTQVVGGGKKADAS